MPNKKRSKLNYFPMNAKKLRPAFKYSLFAFLFIIAAAPCLSEDASTTEAKMRVLFIGNSLTSANNLPAVIERMASARHHVLKCVSYAPGGYRLNQHASDAKVLTLIKNGPWDFVVLQDQGQMLALSEDRLRHEVYPYAKYLCESIRAANPNAKVVFYMTMARRSGDSTIFDAAGRPLTYKAMQERTIQNYLTMAAENPALIAPVGRAWEAVRGQNPSANLYADDMHPNQNGAYLAACIFYKVFFNENSSGLPPMSIDQKLARLLQMAADMA